MTYTIKVWKHSADKDHTQMTWGTLKLDKTVTNSQGITFYIYWIPMYEWEFNTIFHKWIHTAEHLLAYKQDTWSVRNSLEEVSNWKKDGKVILDISPYQINNTTFGFRITSMIQLWTQEIWKLMNLSITRAIAYLEKWEPEDIQDYEWIPFARARSCGQFDFHNKQKAISDLKSSLNLKWEVIEEKIITKHTTAYVCDLRFLKPKIYTNDESIMFSPSFSYKISQLIEKYLPLKIPWTLSIVWTFGCMTWMYLCVSSELWDETDLPKLHAAIIQILKEYLNIHSLDIQETIQFQKILENYQSYWTLT